MVGQIFLTGPQLGDLNGIMAGEFERTPAGIIRRNVGWEFWNGPRLGESEVFLVGKHEREALGEMDGDVVWWSKGGCLSVKRKGPGLGNVWNGCEVGSLDVQLLRGSKTKVVR